MRAQEQTQPQTQPLPRSRRQILERVCQLGSTEHEEVFRIMRRHGVPYTQNNNGVFFNLSTVAPEVMEELDRFVQYCHSNQRDLDEYDKRMNECKVNSLMSKCSTVAGSSSEGARSLVAVLGQGNEKTMMDPTPVRTVRSSVAQSGRAQAMAGLLEDMLQRVQKRQCNKFMLAKKRFARVSRVGERRLEDQHAAPHLVAEQYTYKGIACQLP